MSDLRITASTMFAIEMTRAILVQHLLLPGIDLTSPWKEMEMELSPVSKGSEGSARRIRIVFQLHGFERVFISDCVVFNRNEGWCEGSAQVDLNGGAHPFRFRSKLVEDKIITEDW